MPNFSISNLVMNHPMIFKGIKFNLTWATDEEMHRLMYAYYATQDMAFPDESLMTLKIQLKADLISEYWNKLAELKKIEYDPIENYNRYEESADKNISSGNNSSKGVSNRFEYPMNVAASKQTGKVDSNESGNFKSDTDNKHTAHIHGNIGVTTSQQMMQSEFDIQKIFSRMKQEYIKEYENLFMVVI